MYPEYYRKQTSYVKGSNEETPEPFRVGRITDIYTDRSGRLGLFSLGETEVP